MDELDYTLTVTFKIPALDDPDARRHAKILLHNLLNVDERQDIKSIKLQEVKHRMIPRGIPFNHD